MVQRSEIKSKAAGGSHGAKSAAPKSEAKTSPAGKSAEKHEEKGKAGAAGAKSLPTQVVKRVINPMLAKRPIKRSKRSNLFSYMKAPGYEHEFEVGDTVEVFCDHEKNRERIRGWVKGIVVQVDYKMVAVQFRSNVYLTDGWMVPDRILWYPLNSEHMRPVPGKKSASAKAAKKDYIPEY